MPKSKREKITNSAKTGFLVLALVGMTASPAFALEGDFTNDTTGANSSNSNTANHDANITINITNTGNVTNDVTVDLNTGGNNITDNTKVGDVKTGDVAFNATVETQVNDVNVDLKGMAANSQLSMSSTNSITSTNRNTGSGSTNSNTSNTTTNYNLDIQNNMNVVNSFDLAIDTGNNNISRNTTVGDITTGSIDVAVNVATTGNQVDLGGQGGGGFDNPVTTDDLPDSTISSVNPVTNGGGLGMGSPMEEIIGGGGGEFFPAGDSAGFSNLLALLLFSIITVLVSEKMGAVMKRQVNLA